MSQIEPGFNSDIMHGGLTYHVQTEDWGADKSFVVTRVFKGGTVFVSIKTPYAKIVAASFGVGRQAIRLGMREQHQRVLDHLVAGTLIESQHKILE